MSYTVVEGYTVWYQGDRINPIVYPTVEGALEYADLIMEQWNEATDIDIIATTTLKVNH